jgi:hypothetical protein
MANLKGKVALVTGATSGIGQVTAEYLAGDWDRCNWLHIPALHIHRHLTSPVLAEILLTVPMSSTVSTSHPYTMLAMPVYCCPAQT